MRIGIDLVDVARFARIATHPGGRRLVFTAAELAVAGALGERRRGEYLAGRFCAKEAVAKVLGHGLGQGLVWRDIEIVSGALGAPEVRLGGGARAVAEREGVEHIDLSLSHSDGFVMSVAVALPRLGPAGTGT